METAKIETEKEYKRVLAEVETLVDQNTAAARLDEIGALVEAYEEEHYPMSPPDPAAMAAFPKEQAASVKVWLDDERPAPAGFLHAHTAHEAITLLESGCVTEISLDHDLGDKSTCGDGYEVVCWVEEAVALRGFEPPVMRIHSANSVGRQRMAQAIASIERLRARKP